MRNVFFPDEEVTANDLYFVCYMVEYIARRLKQPNRYVVNAMGKRSLQEKLSLAGVLHCENPEAVASDWIEAYGLQPGEFDVLVGTSSRDIAVTKRVNVVCRDPFGWNGRAAIGKIAANPKAVELINRIIEDDILILCHVALDFAPDKSLKELWDDKHLQGTMQSKGWSTAEINAKYEQIMDEFALL